MATRITDISDNFNRANADPIPAPWRTVPSFSPLQIITNRAEGDFANTDCIEQYNQSIAADQWAQVTIPTLSTAHGSAGGVGVWLRMPDASALQGYLFTIQGLGTITRIYRFVTGFSAVVLVEDLTTVWGPGDKIAGEAEGSALRLYRTPSAGAEGLLLSTTDGQWTGAGYTGLMISTFGTTLLTDVEADDYLAGHLETQTTWLPQGQTAGQGRSSVLASGMSI